MMEFKNITKNLLKLFLGCMVFFAMLEILLRFYNPIKLRVKGDKITLPVNIKYTLHNNKAIKLDKIITYSRNSLGFRGEEAPKDFENYLTIIAVGGSTTECLCLSDKKTWPYVLGMTLKKDFKHVWVNNAGLDGHSTYGHIKLMENYLIDLKPKIVLFFIGLNDIAKRNEMVSEKWITNSEEGGSYLYNVLRNWPIRKVPWIFLKRMANYSEVFAIVLNFIRYNEARKMGLTHNREHDLKKRKTIKMSEERKKQEMAKAKETLKPYETRLRKLIQLSKDNGIKAILITQPILYGDVIDDVTNIYMGTLEVFNVSGKLISRLIELYNDVTRQVGKEENIMVIDLSKEMPKSSRYFYDAVHYTNKGSEKVAEIIRKNLRPFLKKEYPDFYRPFTE